MRYLDADELLSKVGLERKPATGDLLLGALVPFGVGILVGAGIALLLAPKSGRELRAGIRHRIRREQIAGESEQAAETTKGAV
jgi:gas vesicle protein